MNCGGDGFLFGALSVTIIVVIYTLLKWMHGKMIDAVEGDFRTTKRDLKTLSSDLDRHERNINHINLHINTLYNQFYKLKKQLTEDKKENENTIS